MVEINFGASNYVRNAPGVPLKDTIIKIPDSGELRRVPDYLDFKLEDIKDVTPRRSGTYSRFPTVSLSKIIGSASEDLWMMWIESRREWIAIYHSNWYESDAWGDDDSYSGPFRVEDYQAIKILEAYGVPVEKLPLEKVLHTEPAELEKLVKSKQ